MMGNDRALLERSDIGLVNAELIAGKLPLIKINSSNIKTMSWMGSNSAAIRTLLQDNGALLLRGLSISGSKQFADILECAFDAELLPYIYRSTPRTELKGNVFTATEYHSDQVILQHNENAYSNRWPMRIGFMCVTPSSIGGATPIADSRKVFRDIPVQIKDKFESKGIMYVRNYSDIDLPWSEVFGTSNKQDVEQFCTENRIGCEWLEGGGLKTTQVNPAVQMHPVTQEKVWFNQAHLFHISSLDSELAEGLLTAVGKARLPRNAYYGDGSEIEPEFLQAIRDVYAMHTVRFSWEKSDVLLLDNMLFSHGREAFSGERKVLTGMAVTQAVSS